VPIYHKPRYAKFIVIFLAFTLIYLCSLKKSGGSQDWLFPFLVAGLNPFKFFWQDWRYKRPYRRFRDREDRPRRLNALIFSWLTIILGALYLLVAGRLVLKTRQVQDFLFLGAEILAFLLLAFLALDLWHLRYHPPEGLEAPEKYPVDIFITCCGEPLEVIRTTLKAAQEITYQPREIYVLDDGGGPMVAELARTLGFHYHSRPLAGAPLRDSKSGNLNFGLTLSQGELILVLDADQIPAPDILTRLTGYFRFPEVAYVQAKPSFFLPDGDPFFNRDEIFYDTVQLSNDQANAVISCGSGVVYRRRALEGMGGFATWNIVEDLTTSYELVSRGWKGIYHRFRQLSMGYAK
jgi:cellulose synthase (UDP-forming)